MTEKKWLAYTWPRPLLNYLNGRVSDRKFRLVACACCRDYQVVGQDTGLTQFVTMMESYADGAVSRANLPEVRRHHGPQTVRVMSDVLNTIKSGHAFSALCKVLKELGPRNDSFVGHVRDIFGNPFRPVAFDPAWHTSAVVALAEAIYADRAFDRLPILADALQDAGCEDADILAHCRGPGPHVRGCWVVDLVLDKQ